jgi:hypothetical protein
LSEWLSQNDCNNRKNFRFCIIVYMHSLDLMSVVIQTMRSYSQIWRWSSWLLSEGVHKNVPGYLSQFVKHKTSEYHRKSFLWSCSKRASLRCFYSQILKRALRVDSNNVDRLSQSHLTQNTIMRLMVDGVPMSYALLNQTSTQVRFHCIDAISSRTVVHRGIATNYTQRRGSFWEAYCWSFDEWLQRYQRHANFEEWYI